MKTEDLHQALAAFLIGFGQTLPAELAHRIQKNVAGLAEQIERGGEPNVARLARGLADALVQMNPPASH